MATSSRQIWTAWLTLLLFGSDLFCMSPLIPTFTDVFHIEMTIAGHLFTVYALAYAIGGPIFSRLAGSQRQKSFIIIGMSAFIFSQLISSLSFNFYLLFAMRFVAGLCAALVVPQIFSLITKEGSTAERSGRLSTAVSGFVSALWLGAPLLLLMNHMFQWRMVFGSLAVMGCIILILNILAWGKPLQQKSVQLPGQRWGMVGSVLVTVIWGTAVYGFYSFMGAAVTHQVGNQSSWLSLSVILYGVGSVVGSLLTRFFIRWLSVTLMPLIAFTLLSLVLMMETTLYGWMSIYVLGFIVWGGAAYWSFTAFQGYLVHQYSHQRGEALAWNNTALYVGMLFGSTIGSLVIGYWGYLWLPFVCGVVGLTGVGAFLFVNVRHRANVNKQKDPAI